MRKLLILLASLILSMSFSSAQPADTLWQKELSSYCMQFSPVDPILAVGNHSSTRIFDIQTGDILKSLSLPGYIIRELDFSNDGEYLSVYGHPDDPTKNFRLIIYNTENLEIVHTEEFTTITDLDFSPDGLFLAVSCAFEGLRVFDTGDWTEIIHWQEFPSVGPKIPRKPSFEEVSFRYDSEAIAITLGYSESRYSWKGYIFDLATQELTDTLEGMVDDAQFSPVANELMALKLVDFPGGDISFEPIDYDYYKFDESEVPITFSSKLSYFDMYSDKFKWTNDGYFIYFEGNKSEKIIKLNDLQIIYVDSIRSNAIAISQDNKYFATGGNIIYMLKIENYLGYESHQSSDFINIYPNPADDNIRIEFSLPESSEIELMIRDLLGNEIMNTVEFKEAGTHYIDFDTNVMFSGTYFVNLRIGSDIYTKQFEVVR